MVTLVDSKEEYDSSIVYYDNSDLVIVPIYGNEKIHPVLNQIICLFIYCNNKLYCYTKNHNEQLYESDIEQLLRLPNKKYIYDSKKLLNLYPSCINLLDIALLEYLNNSENNHIITNKLYVFYEKKYPIYTRINALVSIEKLEELVNLEVKYIQNVLTISSSSIDKVFLYYNNQVIPYIACIERMGLRVSKSFVDTVLELNNAAYSYRDGLLYSQYNLYTTTGRPSNRFNNVNFAALDKSTGIRKMIVSRFDSGRIIEFDYESFHLRIISNLIGYTFPKDISIHEYLGRYYFNTASELTKEQYDKSKKISFQLLYGNISEQYDNVPFFKKVKEFVRTLYYMYNNSGYIESPISGRRIVKNNDDILNSSKLFNYLIQLCESEYNFNTIKCIQQKLVGYQTKLINYVYDSFLFDFNLGDGKQLILDLNNTIQNNNFKTRIYAGENYGEMKAIKL